MYFFAKAGACFLFGIMPEICTFSQPEICTFSQPRLEIVVRLEAFTERVEVDVYFVRLEVDRNMT